MLIGLISLFFLYPSIDGGNSILNNNSSEQKDKEEKLVKPEMGNEVRDTKYGMAMNETKFSWETDEFTEQDLFELGRLGEKMDPKMKQQSQIPPIIHQSWKSSELDGNFLVWSNSWKRLHPEFTYILWTDDDNRLLVQKYFPWFLPAYDMFPRKIMRIDIIRCIYLYRYGGLYADLDVIPIKSHVTLYQKYAKFAVILGSISNDDDFVHNVPNAWMASKPGHDFWLMNVNLATQRAYSYPTSAEGVTGPILLKDCYYLWGRSKHSDIKVLDPGLVFGIDWRNDRPEACSSPDALVKNRTRFEECKAIFPNMYALTVWSHSWE